MKRKEKDGFESIESEDGFESLEPERQRRRNFLKWRRPKAAAAITNRRAWAGDCENERREKKRDVVHQTLRLQPYQQVSHLIYRMPYVSDGMRFFPCQLMDDGGMNQMFVCHAACLPYLPMPVIEICAQITGVLQDYVGGDYIPEAPLQTVMSQEFLGSQPTADDDEYGGAITEVERLLSIPTAAPNDDTGDEEYEDQLMGNDIEDGDYEDEDPNNYE
ncbi:uncharacterized protein G2W53_040714 [Senna tora]|uniref:Uncharacterized protein n=1 Tax=Senna tora TaxID=362788 RepID=A0A834VXE7_9FABA|nr:uncharacterized protein G2W53_040714 [Senna tora]